MGTTTLVEQTFYCIDCDYEDSYIIDEVLLPIITVICPDCGEHLKQKE